VWQENVWHVLPAHVSELLLLLLPKVFIVKRCWKTFAVINLRPAGVGWLFN